MLLSAVVARRFISTLYWLLMVTIGVSIFPLAVLTWAVTMPFDRRKVLLHQLTCVWAGTFTWLSPVWSLEVRGRKTIDPRQTYMMVANHLSVVDIFVLYRLFWHFKWVSKEGNFKIPFIGWNMHLNRYIPLRRGDRASVKVMFRRCRETLASGSSIMMFPEGGRSRTGKVKTFKSGAFELAKEAHLPIVPVLIQGTREALPAKGFLVWPSKIRVTVLPVIPAEEVEARSVEALTEHTQALMATYQTEHPWPPAAA